MDSSTRMTRERLGVGMALLLAGLPSAAKEVTDPRASEQFRAGQTAYDKGDYERALSAFSTAYGLQPIPSLLFDIAQCHRQLGNYERAAVFYQQYLELSPGTQNAAVVRTLLSEMQSSEKEKKRRLADGDRVRRAILKTSEQSAPVAAVDAAKRPSPQLTESKALDGSSIFQRWWFWTGAGAIALGTTAYILATHASGSTADGMLAPSRAR